MSNDPNKLDATLDAWLRDWPAPSRPDSTWDDLAGRVLDRIADTPPGGADDAWLAAPLPAEPDEGRMEPVKQGPSEVRMSEPGAEKKRTSLKDIAQRVSAAPPPPVAPGDAAQAPPSARVSSPDLATRPAFVSHPPEARDSDSGIVDLAAVRASQASLPDSGAAPGTSSLFDDDKDKEPAAAAPAAPKAAASRSSNVIPLFGGGVVAIAAIAAAFFLVMKRSPSDVAGSAPPAPMAAASAVTTTAIAETERLAAAEAASAATLPGAAPTTLAMNDEPSGTRGGGAATETGKGAARGEESKKAGDKAADGKKEPEAAAPPTDLGGAMATAVGANTSQPAPDKKDTPAGPAPGSIPEAPSQGAIQGALGSVMGAAKGCVAGMDAPSRATVVFGSNGRVRSVSVSGPAASTGAAGCIKAALSKASVGPFTRDSYSVGVTIRP